MFSGVLGVASLSLPMRIISSVSCLSLLCMIGGLAALITCGFGTMLKGGHHPHVEHKMLDPLSLPSAIGIFLYCFSGLPCLPNIRASMIRTSEYSSAVHLSFAFAFAYYAAIGVCGYYFFGHMTRSSFTENLHPVAGQHCYRFLLGVTMMSAVLFAAKLQSGFPLYAQPVLQGLGFGPERASPVLVWLARSGFCIASITFAVF